MMVAQQPLQGWRIQADNGYRLRIFLSIAPIGKLIHGLEHQISLTNPRPGCPQFHTLGGTQSGGSPSHGQRIHSQGHDQTPQPAQFGDFYCPAQGNQPQTENQQQDRRQEDHQPLIRISGCRRQAHQTGQIEPGESQDDEGQHDHARDFAGDFGRDFKMASQFQGCQSPERDDHPAQICHLPGWVKQYQQQYYQQPDAEHDHAA